MKPFKIEHIGICVEKPLAMAEWYRDVLGFTIIFSAQDNEKGVAFLKDCEGKIMFEFGQIPDVNPLSSRLNHHLQLHIAFVSDDPEKDAEYLVSQGAVFIEKCPITLPGELLIALRDPWGNTLQLVKRA